MAASRSHSSAWLGCGGNHNADLNWASLGWCLGDLGEGTLLFFPFIYNNLRIKFMKQTFKRTSINVKASDMKRRSGTQEHVTSCSVTPLASSTRRPAFRPDFALRSLLSVPSGGQNASIAPPFEAEPKATLSHVGGEAAFVAPRARNIAQRLPRPT